jgi:flagellin
MPQVINTNIASLNTQRQLVKSGNAMQTAMERLSSGLRVNSAKDDSAGLAIAERMTATIRGMNVAIRNAGDGISLAQTAEAGMGQLSDLLQRMRELAVQSANASNDATDRANLDTEFGELASEITRVITSTEFNNKKILGADAGAQVFQVGAENAADNQITVTTTDLTADAQIGAAGTVTTGDITSQANAQAMMGFIDTALDTITTQRATFGATQNRFDSTIATLQSAVQNQSSARSRIMDADFAAETSELSRAQILQQAGTAMLAQANASTQNVLSLLRG